MGSETYNLFNSIERANALRKQKAWLKGKPFYRAKIKIEGENGEIEYKWILRLVNEYAPAFNKIEEIENGRTNHPTEEWSGEDQGHYEDHEGRPSGEIHGVEE